MMPIEKTLFAYTTEKFNCAQSVLRGFQEKTGVVDETVLAARALGGGRAPGGVCGALYAAMELTKSVASRQALTDAFVQQAGSDKCREIKKTAKFSCENCVRLAAEELARVIDPI